MIVVAWWGNEARLLVETRRAGRTTIQRGLEITRVLLQRTGLQVNVYLKIELRQTVNLGTIAKAFATHCIIGLRLKVGRWQR